VHRDTTKEFAGIAVDKIDYFKRNPIGFFISTALVLIIFAGADLFSGHIMYMTFGFLYKKIGMFAVIKDWIICWYGNLLGARHALLFVRIGWWRRLD